MSRQQKNAFTMHSNAQLMLSKNAATVPSGMGGFTVFTPPVIASEAWQSRHQLIHWIASSFLLAMTQSDDKRGHEITNNNNYSIHSFINLIHSL